MKCPKCGKEFEGNFCPYCGTENIDKTSSYHYIDNPNITKQNEKIKSNKKIAIIILILLIEFLSLLNDTDYVFAQLPDNVAKLQSITNSTIRFAISGSDILIKNSSILYEEDLFKNSCKEIKYNDLNDDWIGKYVTKEILFSSVDGNKYRCTSTEDYIEDYLEYQHSYRIYDISDHRFDKSFLIQSDDVIQIYGIVTDIQMNYANGLYYPIIDMYYIDYIRKWREPINKSKTIDEIIQERIAENERRKAESEYFDSLNSDYSGQTKNISGMESLSEKEFKSHCDSMNFKDMFDSTNDLTNRYVKIHLQLTSHRTFISEDAKRRRLDDLVDIYDINDNLWYSNMFYEETGKYVTNPILLYFTDNNTYNPESLTKNQELTVYGLVLNYKINEGYHNSFDFLVVYIE